MQDVIESALGHQRLAGSASGEAISTTAAFVGFHQGSKHIALIPRNFDTAVVARGAYCPYGVILVTTDALATRAALKDNTERGQDGSTSTTIDLSSLPTLANGGAIWVGAAVRYRGAWLNVNAANSTANNLTVHYPAQGSLTLTDISDTDNTDTGPSLAQKGTVTWTVPSGSTWTPSTLRKIANANSIAITSERLPYDDVPLFWTRWTWNAAMDSATSLYQFLLLNENTNYFEWPVGLSKVERIHMGLGRSGVSGIELLVNAGTANLLANCAALDGYFSQGEVK